MHVQRELGMVSQPAPPPSQGKGKDIASIFDLQVQQQNFGMPIMPPTPELMVLGEGADKSVDVDEEAGPSGLKEEGKARVRINEATSSGSRQTPEAVSDIDYV